MINYELYEWMNAFNINMHGVCMIFERKISKHKTYWIQNNKTPYICKYTHHNEIWWISILSWMCNNFIILNTIHPHYKYIITISIGFTIYNTISRDLKIICFVIFSSNVRVGILSKKYSICFMLHHSGYLLVARYGYIGIDLRYDCRSIDYLIKLNILSNNI